MIPIHAEDESSLNRNDAPIAFIVYPGGNGRFNLYEDNGNDQEYDNRHAFTEVESRNDGHVLSFTISPRKGEYDGIPSSRIFELRIPATIRPLKVTVDGTESSYEYIPERLEVAIRIPEKNCNLQRNIVVEFPDNHVIADGTIGNMKRYVETFGELKNKYARLRVNEEFGSMATIYEALEYFPERNTELIDQFRERFSRITEIANNQEMSDKARSWFLKNLDSNADSDKKP